MRRIFPKQIISTNLDLENYIEFDIFQDWEKEHFENLTTRSNHHEIYNLKRQVKKKSPEEIKSMKRHGLLVLSAALILLCIEILQGLS